MAAKGKTAVVLGARGTLGLALCEQLPLAGWSIAAAVARTECDIRDEAVLRALFAETRPTAVFNAAAYTDVDRAELEPEVAFAVNEAGARSVARASSAAGAAVVHYSTDFVFDGEQARPYDEEVSAHASGELRALEGGRRRGGSGGCSAAFHPAGRVPLRARRPKLPLDHRAPLEKGRNHPRRIRERLGSPTWVRRSPASRRRWRRPRATASITAPRTARRPGLTSPSWPPRSSAFLHPRSKVCRPPPCR